MEQLPYSTLVPGEVAHYILYMYEMLFLRKYKNDGIW